MFGMTKWKWILGKFPYLGAALISAPLIGAMRGYLRLARHGDLPYWWAAAGTLAVVVVLFGIAVFISED